MIKVLFLYVFSLYFATKIGEIRGIDKSEWIDPHDMGSFDIVTNKMKPVNKAKQRPEEPSIKPNDFDLFKEDLETCQEPKLSDPKNTHLLKHFLRRLLEKAGVLKSDSRLLFSGTLEFTPTSLKLFRNFLASQESDNEVEIFYQLQEVFKLIAPIEEEKMEKEEESTSFPAWVPKAIQIGNLACILVFLGVTSARLLHANKWKLCLAIFFLTFWASVVWTWMHLYKIKQAELQARIVQLSTPKECQGEEFSLFDYIRKFGQILPQDRCLQYHKDLLIDPIYEVPPMTAIAVTLTKFFMEPAEIIGTGIAKFYSALFGNLHLSLWPFVVISLTIGAAAVLLIVFGYSIRLPFGLLTIGPSPVRNVSQQQVQYSGGNQALQYPGDSQAVTQQTRSQAASQSPEDIQADLKYRKMLKCKRRKRTSSGGDDAE